MEQIRDDSLRRSYRAEFALVLAFCVPAALLLWIVLAVDRLPRALHHAGAGSYATDAIVVLQGDDDRKPYASWLVQQGWAKDVLTTRVWPQCGALDDPPSACRTGVRNTVDEAMVLQRIASEQGMRRVIIVTSRYHLLRTAAVFSIVFLGTGIHLHFVAPPASTLPSWRVALSELVKLVPSVAAAAAGRIAPASYRWIMSYR